MSWGQSFGQKLFDKTRAFEGHIQRRVDRYTKAVFESDTLPEEFKAVFRSSAYKVENFLGEYKAWIRTSVSRYRAAVRQVKLDSREQIAEHTKDAYLAAQKITGKCNGRVNTRINARR